MTRPECSLQSCFFPLERKQHRALSLPERLPVAAQGYCVKCEQPHQLLRTPHSQEIAVDLMQQIRELGRIDLNVDPLERTSSLLTTNRLQRTSGGKMFGVLLCESPSRKLGYIKAFSGQFNRLWYVPGWVPPIPNEQATQVYQAETELQVEQISSQINELEKKFVPVRKKIEAISHEYEPLIEERLHANQVRREARQNKREQFDTKTNLVRLQDLNQQSRADKEALRNIRREYRQALEPVSDQLKRLQDTFSFLRSARRSLSSELSRQLISSYYLRNFVGEVQSLLDTFLGDGIPTGTGDCCAPKLLQFASTHNLRPIGLAEFWMGTPKSQDRCDGEFYSACDEKCCPIVGYMLCGLNHESTE